MVVPDLWREEFFQSSHCNQLALLLALGQPGLHMELNWKLPQQQVRGFEKIIASSLIYVAEVPFVEGS